jgi:CrcB protein
MNQLIIIGIGGAAGAILRFITSKSVQTWVGGSFPFGILAVNLIGSFAIGILATLFIERSSLDPIWRAGILIGLLGGFTTFSSFSLDTINLLRNGAVMQATLYIFSSVFLCLLAAWLGILLGRNI